MANKGTSLELNESFYNKRVIHPSSRNISSAGFVATYDSKGKVTTKPISDSKRSDVDYRTMYSFLVSKK